MTDTAPRSNAHSLIDRDDTVLVVIDIQQPFLDKYDRAKVQTLLSKVAWLIDIAKHLGIPVVAMAEAIAKNGTLVGPILNALPEGTRVHDKDAFGLHDNPAILAAVRQTGRNTAVCVGMETDVCVMHSAIGLLDHGYRVMVPRDAVATTEFDEAIGIERMRDAGVMIGSVKTVFFEWMRSVTGCRALDRAEPDLRGKRPPDLIL